MADQHPPLIRACNLWEKTSKNGTAYLAGRWGGAKILVMPNGYRKGDDDATHVLMLTKPTETRQRTAPDAPQSADEQSFTRPSSTNPPWHGTGGVNANTQIDDDEIPF
jgi:hypothetical protein